MNKLIYAAALTLTFAAANGTTHPSKAHIEVIYQPQANGDYRLFLFGSDRALICEEKPLKIIADGDAINPIVIECKH